MLLIFTDIVKKTPVLESLSDKVAGLKNCIFLKKETPAQVFSCKYCEVFNNSLFYRANPVHYTFPKFYVMIEFFGRLWVQNWHFSYFLCRCFVSFVTVRISIAWLFQICIHNKIFSKSNFRTHCNFGSSTILIQSLKFRNNSRITVTSPSNLLWKLQIRVFLNVMLCYYFSCKVWLKIILPKNKSMQKWSMRQRENSQKWKCKVYRYKLQR